LQQREGGRMTNTATIEPRLIDTKTASRYLAISERKLWSLCQAGDIPVVRLGRAVRYDLSDLDAFIAEAKKEKP
jgi:excisionase family DNA binding protein